jgi:hypothetical protein
VTDCTSPNFQEGKQQQAAVFEIQSRRQMVKHPGAHQQTTAPQSDVSPSSANVLQMAERCYEPAGIGLDLKRLWAEFVGSAAVAGRGPVMA